MKKLHFLILIGLTLLLSCNVHFEKRLYRKGYYVDVVSKNHRKSIHAVEVNNSKNLLSTTPIVSNNSTITESEIISSTKEINETLNPGEFKKEEIIPVQEKLTIKRINRLDIVPHKKLNTTTLFANKSIPVQEQKKNDHGDNLLYLALGLIALSSIAVMKLRPKRVMKISRWAKANPTKNKCLIAGMQVPMVILTVMSGYNLKQLGYELSDTIYYVSGAVILLGLLTTPLKPERSPIAIPKIINRRRMIYLGMILASAMMAVGVGNQIEERYPNSSVVSIIKAIDQAAFSETHEKPSTITEPGATEPGEKNCKCKTSRKVAGVAAAIGCGLVAFYTFLLICFGIGGSVALIVVGALYATWMWWPLIILGVGILALVVWLFYKLFKVPCKKREKKEKVKTGT